MRALKDGLPPVYERLLPAAFDEAVPEEAKATCSTCAMCEGSSTALVAPVDGRSRLFRADTKCCTYHPRLPNYLVGAILADDGPAMAEGRRRVRERIASRVAIDPVALRPPPRFTLLYDSARNAFGRASSLRCPFYGEESGGCTIWRHREAVCSTWFCKYTAGADGRAMWTQAKRYLGLVEIQLARYALRELLPRYVLEERHREAASPVGPAELDGEGATEAEHAARFGEYAGREEALYLACHDVVRGLDRADLARILGLDGELELSILDEKRKAALTESAPTRLRLNPNATIAWLGGGEVALSAYSELDGVVLPSAAFALLVEFTGRDDVASVRARLRREQHADLDDDTLLLLHRHRVLVAP